MSLIIAQNKMTFYTLLHGGMLAAIYLFLGWQSLKYQLCYTFWGIFFLELINYIEHYGLSRSKDKDGIYESITKMHSWNALSSPVMFRLQRHSDHHFHSFRPYQILRRFDEAPFLPFNYSHCFILVLCPPLWFYLVNPRVDAITDLKFGRKNSSCFDFIKPFSADDKKI